MVSRLAVLLLVAALVAIVAVIAFGGRRADARRDAAWIAGTWQVPPDEVRVYVRYLARVRAHRRAGGWFGVVFAVIVGIAYAGTVAFGISAAGPLGDVLFCGVAGVLVGALSAEVYRLRVPRAAKGASASLAPRPALPGARQVVTARVLVAIDLATGAALTTTGHASTALLAACLGAVLVILCEATRAAVAHRRRGALSDRALVVDGNLRTFAAGTIAWLDLTAGTLALTWAASGAATVGWLPYPLQVVIPFAGLFAAVVFLVKASPRPPRTFPWSVPSPCAGTVPIA